MPEPTDEELGIPEGLDPNIRAELRKSRSNAKAAEEAKKDAEAALRELAFVKAGIPETGTGALFRKAYDGDTSVEAIQKAAAEFDIIPGAPSAADTAAAAEAELERQRQIIASNNGGVPLHAPGADEEFVKAMIATTNEDEAWAVIERLGAPAGVRRHIQG